MIIRLGSAAAVQRLEFLSNSRGCRNARARGRTESGSTWAAFVFCENIALFCQRNQQYLKPDFAE
jgi:hypothetical protein